MLLLVPVSTVAKNVGFTRLRIMYNQLHTPCFTSMLYMAYMMDASSLPFLHAPT